MADDDAAGKKAKQYSSRISRARAHNREKIGLTKAGATDSNMSDNSMANMAFSIPVQAEVDMVTAGVKNMAVTGTPSMAKPPKAATELTAEATIFCKPEDENSIAAYWEWNSTQKLLAVVRGGAGSSSTLLAARGRPRAAARPPPLLRSGMPVGCLGPSGRL
jgi:hypothetical protein